MEKMTFITTNYVLNFKGNEIKNLMNGWMNPRV